MFLYDFWRVYENESDFRLKLNRKQDMEQMIMARIGEMSMLEVANKKGDRILAAAMGAINLCPYCGRTVVRNPMGRPKRFCSEECRKKYKNRHRNGKDARIAICPECGKGFIAQGERRRMRKYCSRACANRGRARNA